MTFRDVKTSNTRPEVKAKGVAVGVFCHCKSSFHDTSVSATAAHGATPRRPPTCGSTWSRRMAWAPRTRRTGSGGLLWGIRKQEERPAVSCRWVGNPKSNLGWEGPQPSVATSGKGWSPREILFGRGSRSKPRFGRHDQASSERWILRVLGVSWRSSVRLLFIAQTRCPMGLEQVLSFIDLFSTCFNHPNVCGKSKPHESSRFWGGMKTLSTPHVASFHSLEDHFPRQTEDSTFKC